MKDERGQDAVPAAGETVEGQGNQGMGEPARGDGVKGLGGLPRSLDYGTGVKSAGLALEDEPKTQHSDAGKVEGDCQNCTEGNIPTNQ